MLDEFGAFPAVIERELQRYLPFLATTKVLMAAVRTGWAGRRRTRRSRSTRSPSPWRCGRRARSDNDLLDRLAADGRLGVSRAELDAAIADPLDLAGTAGQQVAVLAARIGELAAAHPEAAAYRPGLVL